MKVDEKINLPKENISLAVCMILRNEGTTIYRCLDSMKTFIDEWIIGIDERTDDNTLQEVHRFFDDNKDRNHIGNDNLQIYKFKWDNDFSKARNEGLEKAKSDFILIMDGHEYFPESWFNITCNKNINVIGIMPRIKEIIAQDNPDDVFFNLYQQPFNGMIPNNFFIQPRIYKNKKEMKFNRPAHNTMTNSDPKTGIDCPEIIIIHDAPEDNRTFRKKQRVEMNIKALKENIKDNPKDTRAWFYLGNTYMDDKKWNKAIQSFDKYLANRDDECNEQYQVCIHKALCYKELKNYKLAKRNCFLAKACENVKRDAYILCGDIYYLMKRPDLAIFEYQQALKIMPKNDRMFQNGAANTFDPHQKLAMCYFEVKNIAKAITHLQAAYNIFPHPEWLSKLKEWQDNKPNIYIIDRGGSFTRDFYNYLAETKKYNIIMQSRYDEAIARWANYIWAEWANDDAYLASVRHPKKTVIRLHGWEAYGARNLHNQIKWNNVKKTVFVCNHIKDMMIGLANIQPEKTIKIYNGVDTNKFFIKEETRDWKNVGYAGYMNNKKNPFLLLQIIKRNPQFIFHLRIDHQDPYIDETFKFELAECKNVVYHGWYENLNDFWNQMSIVLSTSLIESFSYNVAEGMSAGCYPYIYNWKGAKDLYPNRFIFDKFPEFQKKIELADRKKCRQYIIDHYPLDKSLQQMEEVLVNEN